MWALGHCLLGAAAAVASASLARANSACTYHCATSPCGPTPTLVNRTFILKARNETVGIADADVDDDDLFIPTDPDESVDWAYSGGLATLDLSDRGIVAIAPGAFDCYAMDNTSARPTEYRGGGVVQAIVLDDNALTEVPSGGVFLGCPYVSMENNQISKLNASAFAAFSALEQSVYLQNNGIDTLTNATFAGFHRGQTLRAYLFNNKVERVDEGIFQDFNGTYLFCFLHDNAITTLGPSAFSGFGGGHLYVYLLRNRITSLVDYTFDGFSQSVLKVYMEDNLVINISSNAFSGFGGSVLLLGMQNNSVTELADGLFRGFNGGYLYFHLFNNSISRLGRIFHGATFNGDLFLSLRNNSLTSPSLQRAMQSWTLGVPSLVSLDLCSNALTIVPPELFLDAAEGDVASGTAATVALAMTQNPIAEIHPDVFVSRTPDFGRSTEFARDAGLALALSIDVSETTVGGALMTPQRFNFSGPVWSGGGSTLQFTLRRTGVSSSLVNAFAAFTGPAMTLDMSQNSLTQTEPIAPIQGSPTLLINYSHNVITSASGMYSVNGSLDLSHNAITAVEAGSFSSRLSALNLSHNDITVISPHNFDNYSFELQVLDVSHNRLTLLSIDVMSTIPGLNGLNISYNGLLALPTVSNHIPSPDYVRGNVLRCDSYGPSATGCTCSAGYTVSTHCNYVRCTKTSNGCSAGTEFNSSDCNNGPFSCCVAVRDVPRDQYYDAAQQAFRVVTDCRTEFEDARFPGGGHYLDAYEYAPQTATTNRLCSICSVCPHGYETTACTPTSNTYCSKDFKLGPGAVAAIALGVFVLVLAAALGWARSRYEMSKRESTSMLLEMTAAQVADLEEQQETMRRAWSIERSDLVYGDVIGVGGFGTVYRGFWGHIQVAIKVLRTPLEDLDERTREDFSHEISFMESIRHPHLLSFFGAGVDDHGRAFLVTELMERGSLQTLLTNNRKAERERGELAVAWGIRLSFASDASRGMKYLHELGAVHRDLKADNCFVDNFLRVKIADFGTGRLSLQINNFSRFSVSSPVSSPLSPVSDSSSMWDTSPNGSAVASPASSKQTRGLTALAGSLLWMPPESFRDAVIDPSMVPKIDVYSFGILMWEIWARRLPWEEIADEGIGFQDELKNRVLGGKRPAPPTDEEEAPQGYTELMRWCWRDDPEDRPTFATVLEQITQIQGRMHPKAAASMYESEL